MDHGGRPRATARGWWISVAKYARHSHRRRCLGYIDQRRRPVVVFGGRSRQLPFCRHARSTAAASRHQRRRLARRFWAARVFVVRLEARQQRPTCLSGPSDLQRRQLLRPMVGNQRLDATCCPRGRRPARHQRHDQFYLRRNVELDRPAGLRRARNIGISLTEHSRPAARRHVAARGRRIHAHSRFHFRIHQLVRTTHQRARPGRVRRRSLRLLLKSAAEQRLVRRFARHAHAHARRPGCPGSRRRRL